MPPGAPSRTLRVIGFDDGPFEKRPGAPVPLLGVVCAGTRFEGMVYGQVARDGVDATGELVRLLRGGKFLPQLRWVLLDGIAFGGFNVVDLDALSRTLQRPCVAVMRRPPDLAAVERALFRLPDAERRWATLQRAGAVHQLGGFTFQVRGATPAEAAAALAEVTDRGRVPEALRLAHLIGGALAKGQSGRRA